MTKSKIEREEKVENVITNYVTISEKGEKEKMANKKSPLEDNWEMAVRIKEIISENDEKWKRIDKERRELKARMIEKERRFEVIKEKKRKWEDRKPTQNSKEAENREKVQITHYEMWYNVWERRRGRKTNMEKVLEEREKERKLTEWERREELVGGKETSKKEGGPPA